MVARPKHEADALIARWIEENDGKPGSADARLREYGVAVWAIVGHMEGVAGDAAQTAGDYDVPLEAVRAALAWYDGHRAAIDARRARNRPVDAASTM